ncbi:hypothetical protein NL676_035543 [Syzygium grande]|nr:hypothetical protein NL676_035543 [Syzygium grande]
MLGQLVISVYKLAEVIVCEWVLCLPASPLQIFFTGAGREQRVTGSSISGSYGSGTVEQQLMSGGSGRKRGHSGEATPMWRLCTCATDYLS